MEIGNGYVACIEIGGKESIEGEICRRGKAVD